MQIINTEESKKLVSDVENLLKSDKEVKVTGLGIFKVKDRAERKGRNPKTGEAIVIPAGKKVALRLSSSFKKAVL